MTGKVIFSTEQDENMWEEQHCRHQGGEGAGSAGAEILLQPMEDHGDAEIHLQPMEETQTGADGCSREGCKPAGAGCA